LTASTSRFLTPHALEEAIGDQIRPLAGGEVALEPVMGLHKLTGGDGYTYLTRQVAVQDCTDRGRHGLGVYYDEKGESPGRWWGSGLAALGIVRDDQVTEQQMKNLFGEGRHPNAESMENAALDAGGSLTEAKEASQLGRLFAIYQGNAPAFIQETARRYQRYNAERGEHWKAAIPAEVRARIRTEIANEMFANEHGRAPLDDRERSGFLAQVSRQQTNAVVGFDLPFSPVKSVSTLWAVAGPDVAKQVEAAHHAAVTRTLAYLEKEVLYTRRGRSGVQQVKAKGLIVACFTHRDARSGDPDLHTHVAISNKVQDATGTWLAIDGSMLFQANVPLSEMYNTLIEAELVDRLGVAFEDRDAGSKTARAKESVREIVGIDVRLMAAWSQRRTAIDARRRTLAAQFQEAHGRPPTAVESIALAQQATLETRQAKHEPRSELDQRATWQSEAARVLGSSPDVTAMVSGAIRRSATRQEVTKEWVEKTAERVVAAIQQRRATWQIWHLRSEAQRQLRRANIRLDDLDTALEQVVAAAITTHSVAFATADPLTDPALAKQLGTPIPAALLREDGESVYTRHGAQRFTSTAVLDAERRILEAAQATGARTISDVRLGIALAESAANGVTLNAAQAAMVREFATSGRCVQLSLAPAGTGKTTAMRVLARAWTDSGGTVIGLAPSAVAAEELGSAINSPGAHTDAPSDTLAKLVWHVEHGNEPPWMRRVNGRTMVLIDEAAMAATTDLATTIGWLSARGATVRLIGDDRQLASIAAGGVLRDIADQVGAVTLGEVRRFLNRDDTVNTAEAAATLAVRDGEPAALGYYADRGRIHVGDRGTAADQAYAAWTTDTATGQDSLMLAPTRALVAELNTRARNDRLATATGRVGRIVSLADGTRASAGDVIVTRENNRFLALTATDWVKNGDRWTVTKVHRDGSLTARHHKLGIRRHLPADYVAMHVQLGYAATVHGAQGATVDTCHLVLTGDEDRNLLYVGTTRGRYANHLYLATATDGDPHDLIRPESVLPLTALDQLAAILERDGSPVSATSEQRALSDPATMLCDNAARYLDAVTFAAEKTIGEAGVERLETHAAALVPGLTDAEAWHTLRSHLALLACSDHNPLQLVTDAVRLASLDDARDPAAVVDARIDRLLMDSDTGCPPEGPLPWLPAVPAGLSADPDWGAYLTAYADQITTHTAAIVDAARRWTGRTGPDWAQPFLEDADADLRARLAVWRAATGVPDSDLRPTGPRRIGAPGDHQARLDREVRQTRPTYPFAQRGWYQQLPESARHDPWITPLCQRLAKLEQAGLPVADYLTDALSQERPLPDEHQAAALWWRLVPHLGPAAVSADQHTANPLTPTWTSQLEDIVGSDRADYLQSAPAWPALVAAVDEAQHQGWTVRGILTDALSMTPNDGSLTGVEVASALVWHIAALTDDPPPDDAYAPNEPDREAPEDLDDFLAAVYRDDDSLVPHASADELSDLAWDHDEQRYATTGADPYLPRLPGDSHEVTAEHAFPDPDELPGRRILDLNAQALAFYESHYRRSWAPDYLRDRLGTDLTDNAAFAVGYAPPGPRSLMPHLLATGATVDELEKAGLVRLRERRDGTVEYVDAFRDRLIFPVRNPNDPEDVIGFLGRRNPTKTDDDFAGPKYLNTKATPVFTKGEALYGYAEAARALETGALPVLVEGPMDALAVTLATNGTAVGLAPMGTALTIDQIKLIRRHVALVDGNQHVAIAYDADKAGWKAARAAYWQLTAADVGPTLVALPRGQDPSELHQAKGAEAIRDAIEHRRPLGELLVDDILQRTVTDWTDTGARQHIIEELAHVLAARGAETWLDEIARINDRLGLPEGLLQHATLTASIERDHGPAAWAHARVAELSDAEPAYVTRPPALAGRINGHDIAAPRAATGVALEGDRTIAATELSCRSPRPRR
jgi:DNA primase catalytic core